MEINIKSLFYLIFLFRFRFSITISLPTLLLTIGLSHLQTHSLMMSQIRSGMEYFILTYNTHMLSALKVDEKI